MQNVLILFFKIKKTEVFNVNTNNLINEMFYDFQAGKFERANVLLADDFRGTLLGKEVNRPVYISAYRSLLEGIPDLRIHVQNIRTDGTKINARVKISGTNTHAIPALMKGWHEIPATNKKIDGLITELEIILKDDKVEEIRSAHNARGLFAGLLDSLGMDYKTLQQN
jgi:predicted ester cyclase